MRSRGDDIDLVRLPRHDAIENIDHGRNAMARIALVTGGARGIGAEICRVLARDGQQVVVADINLAGARDVCAHLPGKSHAAFQVDVSDESSVLKLFDEVEASLGAISVLVTAAGGPFVRKGEY